MNLQSYLDKKEIFYTENELGIHIPGNVDLEGYTGDFKAEQLTSIGGYVDLRGYTGDFKAEQLTSIGGNVYVNNDCVITLGIKTYNVISIDGIGMIDVNWKSKDGIEFSKAKYLSLPISKSCYVARINGNTAHGETLKAAIEDAKFKALENANIQELVDAVKESNIVTLDQWRVLTGACRSGTAAHLGLTVDTLPESMPLDEVMEKCKGSSYGDNFIELINAEKKDR